MVQTLFMLCWKGWVYMLMHTRFDIQLGDYRLLLDQDLLLLCSNLTLSDLNRYYG